MATNFRIIKEEPILPPIAAQPAAAPVPVGGYKILSEEPIAQAAADPAGGYRIMSEEPVSAPAPPAAAAPEEKKPWYKKLWDWSGEGLVNLTDTTQGWLQRSMLEGEPGAIGPEYEKQENVKRFPTALELLRAARPVAPVQSGILHGAAGAAEDFTSPRGVATMVATGAALKILPKTAAMAGAFAFGGEMAYHGIDAWLKADEMEKSGQAHPQEVLAMKTQAVTSLLMAYGMVRHGTKIPAQRRAQMQSKFIRDMEAGIRNKNSGPESLDYIEATLKQSDIPPIEKNRLASLAAEARKRNLKDEAATIPIEGLAAAVAVQPAKPPIAQVEPAGKMPPPGERIAFQKPGATIRQQFNMPEQTVIPPTGPMPSTEGLPPSRPLPKLPEPPKALQKPLPETPPKKAYDPNGPMYDHQRRAIFGIAGERNIPKDVIGKVAGKPVSLLSATEAEALIARLKALEPEQIRAMRPKAETPLLEKKAEIPTPPAQEVKPAAAPPAKDLKADIAASNKDVETKPQFIEGDRVKIGSKSGIVISSQMDGPVRRYKVRVKNEFHTYAETQLAAPPKRAGGFQYDPRKSLENAVAYHGGINPKEIIGSGLKGEWDMIDSSVRRKVSRLGQRLKLEELVDQVRSEGYPVENGADLLEQLRVFNTAKKGVEPEEYTPEGFDRYFIERDYLKPVREQGNFFGKGLPVKGQPKLEPPKPSAAPSPEKNLKADMEAAKREQPGKPPLPQRREGETLLQYADRLKRAEKGEREPEGRKPEPIGSYADRNAQAEVDRRAANARAIIERVVKGKGTWSEKRRQLDLPTRKASGSQPARYDDLPIGKTEVELAVRREMAGTTAQTGLQPTGTQKEVSPAAKPATKSLFDKEEPKELPLLKKERKDVLPERERNEVIDQIRKPETVSGGRRTMAGSGASTLGLDITPNLRDGNWIDIRGRKIQSREDLVAAARLFRNPSFETLHTIYVKDGVIVAHEAVSSRLPAISQTIVEKSPLRHLIKMNSRIKRLGADGFYLVHNHPSGNVTASSADVAATRLYAMNFPQFKGHVIIDHNTYNLIARQGSVGPAAQAVDIGTSFLKNPEPDVIHSASIPHPGLKYQIYGPRDIAEFGRKFMKPDSDVVVVIYRDSVGKVRAIEQVPVNLFLQQDHFSNWSRGRARIYGGSKVLAYFNDPRDSIAKTDRSLQVENAMTELLRKNIILDGIIDKWGESGMKNVRDSVDVSVKHMYDVHGLSPEKVHKATVRIREDIQKWEELGKEPLFEHDTIVQRLAKRLKEGTKKGRDPIQDPGEAEAPPTPRLLDNIRSHHHVLGEFPETRPIAKTIVKASREKKREMQHFDDLANKAIKEFGIKRNSPEERMVIDLLDEAFTKLTPEKLRVSSQYSGNKEAAIATAKMLRRTVFDPIIGKIRNDPDLLRIIGRKGYIRGYFPHMKAQLEQKYGKDWAVMARALLPEQFTTRFLKERITDEWVNDASLYEILPAYINATMRTIHDIPAYDKTLNVLKGMPESPLKEYAKFYADTYMNQPNVKSRLQRIEKYQKVSRWVAQRYYDNLIGLNWRTWTLNLMQTVSNTIPELGTKFTSQGIGDLMNPKMREKFHESGLLFDAPGMESGIITSGMKHKVLHGGMSGAEYINRGIAFLGGLRKAESIGLKGKDAESFAMDVVDKTQFSYTKEASVYFLERLSPHNKVFMTFKLKEAEYVRNLVREAYRGGKEERAKLYRFIVINAVLPSLIASATGSSVDRYFIGIMDALPSGWRTGELGQKFIRWLGAVERGFKQEIAGAKYPKGTRIVEPKEIPEDILKGIYDALVPARRLIEDVKKAAS